MSIYDFLHKLDKRNYQKLDEEAIRKREKRWENLKETNRQRKEFERTVGLYVFLVIGFIGMFSPLWGYYKRADWIRVRTAVVDTRTFNKVYDGKNRIVTEYYFTYKVGKQLYRTSEKLFGHPDFRSGEMVVIEMDPKHIDKPEFKKINDDEDLQGLYFGMPA